MSASTEKKLRRAAREAGNDKKAIAAAEEAAKKAAEEQARKEAEEAAKKAAEAERKRKAQEEKEARWAELDRLDEEKAKEKAAKKLAEERKRKRRQLEKASRELFTMAALQRTLRSSTCPEPARIPPAVRSCCSLPTASSWQRTSPTSGWKAAQNIFSGAVKRAVSTK